MSLLSPPKDWYFKKVSKDEKMWVVISLLLCIVLFVWMVLWHVYGKQNPSNTTYRTSTTEYAKLSEAYVKKYMVGTDNGIPVVKPEPKSDVFVLAEMWRWSPVLILQKNEAYKLHISSKDLQHGLSIQPINMNFQIYPGYDYVLTFTPTEAGVYNIICNEFCGIGHHTMIGKIVVIESDADLKKYGYDNLTEPAAATSKASLDDNASVSEADMAKLGEKVFALKGCGACHKTDGVNKELGPNWKGLYGKQEQVKEDGKEITITVDDAYIKESIKNPSKKITVGFEKAVMPVLPMDDKEIDQIIAYIKSIK